MTASFEEIARHHEAQIARVYAVPSWTISGLPRDPRMELFDEMRRAGFFDGPEGRMLLRGWITDEAPTERDRLADLRRAVADEVEDALGDPGRLPSDVAARMANLIGRLRTGRDL